MLWVQSLTGRQAAGVLSKDQALLAPVAEDAESGAHSSKVLLSC